jgi:thiol:disulfide interchange protein DsbC
MQQQAMTTLGGFDLSNTLVIGPKGGKEIIEITDPDCPYCRKLSQFINGLPDNTKVQRRIIFDTRAHPSAKKKAAHILCSDNPELEFERVYQNKVSNFKSCPGVYERLQKHQDMALALGVSATPTVILDGSMEVGFRPGAILDYLNSSDTSEE